MAISEFMCLIYLVFFCFFSNDSSARAKSSVSFRPCPRRIMPRRWQMFVSIQKESKLNSLTLTVCSVPYTSSSISSLPGQDETFARETRIRGRNALCVCLNFLIFPAFTPETVSLAKRASTCRLKIRDKLAVYMRLSNRLRKLFVLTWLCCVDQG